MAVLVMLSSACSSASPPSATGDELRLSDLSGVWANEEVTLRINDSGDFIVQPASSDEVVMGGFVARDGEQVVFVTGIGGECPGMSGVYAPALADDGLHLVVRDDPCEPRVGWFDKPFSEGRRLGLARHQVADE